MVRLCSALKEAKEKPVPMITVVDEANPVRMQGAPFSCPAREVGWAVGELCRRGVMLGF